MKDGQIIRFPMAPETNKSVQGNSQLNEILLDMLKE